MTVGVPDGAADAVWLGASEGGCDGANDPELDGTTEARSVGSSAAMKDGCCDDVKEPLVASETDFEGIEVPSPEDASEASSEGSCGGTAVAQLLGASESICEGDEDPDPDGTSGKRSEG